MSFSFVLGFGAFKVVFLLNAIAKMHQRSSELQWTCSFFFGQINCLNNASMKLQVCRLFSNVLLVIAITSENQGIVNPDKYFQVFPGLVI